MFNICFLDLCSSDGSKEDVPVNFAIYIRNLTNIPFLSRTEEPAKVGTCARDRRALQLLALNVHVKHSDLT